MKKLDMESYIKAHASTYENTDYKTKLQESVNTSQTEIGYEIFRVDGPAHDCTYYARVTIAQKATKAVSYTHLDVYKRQGEERLNSMRPSGWISEELKRLSPVRK